MTPPSSAGRRRDRYIALVTVSAAAVLVATNLAADPAHRFGPAPAAFAALAVLLAAGEARPLHWYARTSNLDVTFTWSFAAALALLAPAGTALTTLAVASAFGDLLARRAPSRVLFNVSQLVLSLGAGILVLEAFGERFALNPGAGVPWWWLFIGLVAGMTILLVNGVLVSGVIALDQGVAYGPVLRSSVGRDMDADGLLVALAPAYVLVAERSLPLLVLLMGSALVVHATAQLAVARQHEADHDTLTRLPTRRLLNERLTSVVDATSSSGERAALLICDLDRFKSLNDRLGHAVGDEVLREAARRLEEVARESDLVARFGGDEFAMVAYPVLDRIDAQRIADAIAEALSAPAIIDGFPVAVQASVGAAMIPEDGVEVGELLAHADVAMYEAKRQRSRSAMYTARAGGRGRIEILRDLPAAFERDQLSLRFQPIISVADGSPRGVEALIRWEHHKHGTINPLEFIPMAEETELVRELTSLVLRKALAANTRWRAEGHDLTLSINSSVRNLEDFEFPALVAQHLDRAHLPADRLEIEITESAVLRNIDRAGAVMSALHDQGVRLAVDDFGTGFSSLSYLRHLPIDRLKIDRSFIADLDGPTGTAIVGPLCDLARNLGLGTVAEGVENLDMLRRLHILGCEEAQGYAIAPPLTAAEMSVWLAEQADADRALIDVRDACR